MKLSPHPRYDVYKAWFEFRADFTVVRGEWYRVAGPRHTTADAIVQGIGAYKAGGRWNPPGVMNAVYLSRAPETAMREAIAHFRYFGIPIWKGMPKVMVAVRVEAEHVVDLTDAAVAASLPEPMNNLLAEDWRAIMERGEESTTQAIGRAAYEAGLHGLLVTSKADPGGVNLVLFPGRLTAGCRLEVLNAAALENLGKAT